MIFKGDTSGLDDLIRKIEDAYFSGLSKVGKEAIMNCSDLGSYQNRTGNLRNANGYCVVRNGKIIDLWINNDNSHSQAYENTRNLLIYTEKPNDGLYLANGMIYASYVESKGYNVILTDGLLFAEKEIKEKV